MQNITVRQYSQLNDVSRYEVLENLKPSNRIIIHKHRALFKIAVIKRMELSKMPYANVKYCIRMLPKLSSWDDLQSIFNICFDIEPDEFWSIKVKDYFAARRYMIQAFTDAMERENKLLASQATDEHLWKMAGGDKLQPHSDTLPLVQLGKMLGQYPFDLGRKPYGEILSLLVQTKVSNEVERDYQKLINKK